jgi:type IV fimbrial biogenesis protein FimT
VLKRAGQNGFNMIEIVVAVSILALLAAAALPGMTDWIRSTRLRGVAETTQSGLHKARTEAMKRNQVVTFWLVSPRTTIKPDDGCALASDSAAWVVSVDNPAATCSTAPSSTATPRIVEVFGPGAGAKDIVVAAKASDGTAATSVSFNGYGQVIRTGKPLASIDLTHVSATGRKLRLQISTSGSVRLCDTEVVAPDSRACI